LIIERAWILGAIILLHNENARAIKLEGFCSLTHRKVIEAEPLLLDAK
jgi:hypothetical protein